MESTLWIIDRFAEFEDSPAIVWRGKTHTYRWLFDSVQQWRSDLAHHGVQQGECVAICGDYSPSTCALVFALVANGNIVVPITRVTPEDRDKMLTLAHVQVVFEFDALDQWSVSQRAVEPPVPELIQKLRTAEEAGLVLFTSGSTGERKGIVHSFSRLLAKFRERRRKIRSLVFLLPDHIGGVNTLLHIILSGGTAVYLQDRKSETICQAIQDHQVEVLPTTPTFITMLLTTGAHRNYDMSSLALITYGTEPMPESTLRALADAFPKARLKQTYGLTELGILGTKSKDSKTLWMKVGGEGVETKIVDGKLWIRSQTPMLGYLNAPSPFDEEGWYNTQDEVEVEGEYMRILGRASDIINVGGEKVYPAEVESALLQLDNIRQATVRGRPNPITGSVVTASVSLVREEDPRQLKRRIWKHCSDQGLDRFKIPAAVEIVANESQVSERFKKVR